MLYMFQESGGSWHSLTDRGDLVQQLVATVSATLYTEEVARSVVGALLLIASERELLPYITLDAWLWLKKQPSLPRSCPCCFYGTRLNIVKTVQGLEDIEVLKSYLVIVWSEWNATMDEGFGEMCVSVPKDFGGIGMGHHRADLIQRLDHVLGQLDLGIDYLTQFNPDADGYCCKKMKEQYGKSRDILLEATIKAISRTSHPIIVFLWVPTHANMRRISGNIHVGTLSPMSIGLRP